MTIRTWKRLSTSEYMSDDGHRVYRYHSRSNWDACWGAQIKGQVGDPIGPTKRQAIEWVNKHYPKAT